MVESVQPVSAGALKALGDRLSPEAVRDIASGESSVGVAAKPLTPGEKKLIKKIIEVFISIVTTIPGALDAIDWQGAAEKWKEGQGRPS
jgi:hypothetical protein